MTKCDISGTITGTIGRLNIDHNSSTRDRKHRKSDMVDVLRQMLPSYMLTQLRQLVARSLKLQWNCFHLRYWNRVFDTLGVGHDLTVYFAKTADNTWDI